MSLRLLALFARLGLGLLLFYVTLSLIVTALIDPQIQQAFAALGMLLGCLWWLWSKLPGWLQEAIRSFVRSRSDAHEN